MAEHPPSLDLRAEVRKNLEYIVSIREQLHRYPELSDEETRTAALVRQELHKFGVEDLRVLAGTGVTALIRGGLPGPAMLLRADMDALPVVETADVPYKSVTPGIMHACGHDGHTASLLGVAKIIAENRRMLRGSIRLAFQPAEEASGGALRMIKEGILKNPEVDYAFAFHVWGSLDAGKIGVRSGELWPSCRNDPHLTEAVILLLQEHCGPEYLVPLEEPAAGAEDFAFFSQAVPSFYFMLGIRPAGEPDIPLHAPDFKWNSRLLEYSAWAMLNIVFNLTRFVKPEKEAGTTNGY